MTEETNIVPLFKTYEQLHRDECEIYEEHYDAWHAAYHRWDLVKAALKNDITELSKLAADDTELALAKSEAARLKRAHGDCASFFPHCELAKTLRQLVEKRDERLFGLGALARRSARFATATERRYFGPAATVTTIGAKE